MPKEVYEIFLSSTSEDLRPFRDKIKEVLTEDMQFFINRMENFGAKPTTPIKTCKTEVQKCDALIVVVGKRYGWVPGEAEGGDGMKSITWWEVSWAIEKEIPVYAFLLDQKAELNLVSEQDSLLTATTDEMILKVGRAVRSFSDFKAYLGSLTWTTFKSVDHLALKVATSLHNWLMQIHIEKTKKEVGSEVVVPASPQAPASAIEGKDMHNYEQLYWQEQIHLNSAKCLIKGDNTVGIALIAGRANTEHPALKSNALIRQTDVRSNKDYDLPDDYTTALAGLLVGNSDDGTNYKGMLPGAPLSIYHVLNNNYGSTTGEIVAAIEAAMLEGSKIICFTMNFGKDPLPVFDAVFERAEKKGVIIVCAAGNQPNTEPVYPAALPQSISVAATGMHNELASFSTFGDWIITSAPGVDIPVAKVNNIYDKWSGTTFSSGIISGVIALMLMANKALTPEKVKQILRQSGLNVYKDNMLLGFKQVDAFQAVQAAMKTKKKSRSRKSIDT